MLNDISELENNLKFLKEFSARETGKKEKIEEQLENFKSQAKEIDEKNELLSKVSILLQKTSEYARNQAKFQVESLVTKCLQYIFETNIEFLIEIEEQRGKANAEFYVINEIDDILIKTKPELSRGGGVVDIVSLALRIAFLQTHKPKIEGPLILDEPGKHVSNEYIYNVAEFLKQTSELFNRQIIMVTHDNHLAAIGSNSYKVGLEGSISTITKTTSEDYLDNTF